MPSLKKFIKKVGKKVVSKGKGAIRDAATEAGNRLGGGPRMKQNTKAFEKAFGKKK